MDSFEVFLLAWGCLLPLGLTIALVYMVRKYRRETTRMKSVLPEEWQALESAQRAEQERLTAERARLDSENKRLNELEKRLSVRGESQAANASRLANEAERLNAQADTLANERERIESEGAQLADRSERLQAERAQFDNQRSELDRYIADVKEKHAQEIAKLKEEYAQRPIAEWFEEANEGGYRNETEVETKFIYSMLRNLGYKNVNLDVRYPIEIQVGRNNTRGEADWVVWNSDADDLGRKVRFVVEAKAENQPLTDEVIYQTRSYAFALNAPYYVCTNGKRLMIFRRGVEQDIRVLDCPVEDLPQRWDVIHDLIGANAAS